MKSIFLSRDEVRHLVDAGETIVWRRFYVGRSKRVTVGGLGAVEQLVGERFWAREDFATRDGDDGRTIRIRYRADPPGAEARVVPIDVAPPKYATRGYVSRLAKHMPKWASRLSVELVDVRVEGRLVGLQLKRVELEVET